MNEAERQELLELLKEQREAITEAKRKSSMNLSNG
jgi:hypothetical protein